MVDQFLLHARRRSKRQGLEILQQRPDLDKFVNRGILLEDRIATGTINHSGLARSASFHDDCVSLRGHAPMVRLAESAVSNVRMTPFIIGLPFLSFDFKLL